MYSSVIALYIGIATIFLCKLMLGISHKEIALCIAIKCFSKSINCFMILHVSTQTKITRLFV